MSDLHTVGHSLPRRDAPDKVTGATHFTSDVSLPGMLVGRVLRLPYAHARIRHIDTSAAAALPGVAAVLTAEDLGQPAPRFGPTVPDQPVLAEGRIRFQGEPVAAVAAIDLATAQAALHLIDADCEDLQAASSLDEALAEDAPLVVEPEERPESDPWRASNVLQEFQYGWGDPPGECATVVENEYTFPPVHHYAVEPHGCLAIWDSAGLTVWSGVQHPFVLRRVLAATFDLPLSSVRVVVPPIGGGFGGKGYPKIEPIAAVLARASGRPVKLQLSVEESFRTSRRAAARVRIRTGVDPDGCIRSQEIRADYLVGAYADVALRVVGKASYVACGPYRTPHARITARAVASHTTPSTAFRGFGNPQLSWALESQMDEVARAIQMDALEFRLRNLGRPGEAIIPDEQPVDGNWAEGLRRVAAAIDWDRPRPPGRGRGLAIGVKQSVPASVTTATVRLHADGSATVQVGTTEMGQGSRTVLAQIAAEALGVPFQHVSLAEPDTASVPFDSITASSRSTTLAGKAIQLACEDLACRLAGMATEVLGGPAEVDTRAGRVTGPGGTSLTYTELLARYFGPLQTATLPAGARAPTALQLRYAAPAAGEVIGQGTYRGERSALALGGPAPFWELSFAAAEVEVDAGTGQVRIVRQVGASDVGRAINPAQAVQQDHGATMMGIGHTLFEELHYEAGQLLNPNLIDYRVPVCADLPDEMCAMLIENGDGPGPYGAKGIGESGILGIAPSVANAVQDATGVRIRDLPLRPERVWRALREQPEAR
jgi:CO/xanthine dehydrogenase Mo-binding subunit